MDKLEAQEYQALTKVFADAKMTLTISICPPTETELAILASIIRGLENAPSRDYSKLVPASNDGTPNDSGQWDLHNAIRMIRANASLKNQLIGKSAVRLTLKEKDYYETLQHACVKLSKLLNRSITDRNDDPYIKVGQLVSAEMQRPANEPADIAWKNYCIDLRRQINTIARKALRLRNDKQEVSRRDLQGYMIELIYIRIANAYKCVPTKGGTIKYKYFSKRELAAITHQIWMIYFSDKPVTKTKVDGVIKKI